MTLSTEHPELSTESEPPVDVEIHPDQGVFEVIHSSCPPLLLGESKPKVKTPLASSRPMQSQAEEIVSAWWLEQHPRPAQKFIAIRKVVEACLEAEWPPELIREAMDNVPTVSARWLEGYVNRHKRVRPDKLAAVRRMLEADA